MSSAGAAVNDTVAMSRTVGSRDATPSATVFALLAVTQLAWLGVLVYGAIWLLS
jgi:hypothetical protein